MHYQSKLNHQSTTLYYESISTPSYASERVSLSTSILNLLPTCIPSKRQVVVFKYLPIVRIAADSSAAIIAAYGVWVSRVAGRAIIGA